MQKQGIKYSDKINHILLKLNCSPIPFPQQLTLNFSEKRPLPQSVSQKGVKKERLEAKR
jgi:hypothetical protein